MKTSNDTNLCARQCLQNAPRSAIEWLPAIDVELRLNAIEQCLRLIDLAGIPPEIERGSELPAPLKFEQVGEPIVKRPT